MDLDDTEEEVDTKLQSLSNLQSGEDEGVGVRAAQGALSAAGYGPGLIVMYSLIHGVTPNEFALVPPKCSSALWSLSSHGGLS